MPGIRIIRKVIVLSGLRTGGIFSRCASAICTKARRRSGPVSMPVQGSVFSYAVDSVPVEGHDGQQTDE